MFYLISFSLVLQLISCYFILQSDLAAIELQLMGWIFVIELNFDASKSGSAL